MGVKFYVPIIKDNAQYKLFNRFKNKGYGFHKI